MFAVALRAAGSSSMISTRLRQRASDAAAGRSGETAALVAAGRWMFIVVPCPTFESTVTNPP